MKKRIVCQNMQDNTRSRIEKDNSYDFSVLFLLSFYFTLSNFFCLKLSETLFLLLLLLLFSLQLLS